MAKTKVKLPRKHQARFEYSFEDNEFFNPKALLRPPLFRAAYSDRTAWLMAKAAKLAYIRFEDDDEQLDLLQDRLAEGGFTLLYIFSSGGTEAYPAANPKMAILAFRGTEKNDWRDIWNDLRVRFYRATATERRKGKIHTGFNAAYAEVGDEIEEALEEVKDRPVYITGHSLGGAAVLAAAGRIPDATAVVTIGAPAEPEHVLHNLGCEIETIRAEGEAEVQLAGRPFRIKKSFVEDVEGAKLAPAIAGLKKALLVLHAPLDATVGVENATRIFLAAKHPKSFVTLDDADHLITNDRDALYAADLIAAWAARYVALAPESHPAAGAEEGFVRVAEATPNGFLQDVHVGGHHLLADEPRSVGGTDLGPTPYGLVSAGLGACTAMTIRMYARRKQIPLEHVSVDVTHDKIHAADCEECETKTGKVDVFRREIRLTGDLTAEQRAKLIEIADKCPVHRTLEGEIRIETAISAAAS